MRGLISGLGRRDTVSLSPLSLSLSLWLGPVSRFGCGAGGSVYMGDDDRGRVALMGQ